MKKVPSASNASETLLLDKVMMEAYKQKIAGTGVHAWLFSDALDGDLGRMANLRLVDKRSKELVKLKLQVLA